MTALALAAELEVSVRTIYRDLEALSAAGVPVRTESGPGGGCQLVEGYRFPLRGLRQEEAEALLILGVPGALRELGLDAAVTAAHRQIRVTAGLPGPGGPDGALVHLDMPRWFRVQEQVPHLRTLAEALRQGRRLAIEYRHGDDRQGPAPRPGRTAPRGSTPPRGRTARPGGQGRNLVSRGVKGWAGGARQPGHSLPCLAHHSRPRAGRAGGTSGGFQPR